MSYVKTFTGWTPIPRFDGTKWTAARLEESASLSGPWTPVETFALADYADPAAPPAFSFTSDLVTIVDGWFHFVWLDSLNGSSVSDPERAGGAGGVPPSVSEIRSMSEFVRLSYPASPFDAQREQDVSNARATAIEVIQSLTGRALDGTLPAALVETARRAVVLKTEQLLAAFTRKSRRSAFGQRALRSFTAGPYSETYFTPDDAAKAARLDPDPVMHELLWALATDEMRDYWTGLWTGNFRPATGVVEVAWGARGFDGYGRGPFGRY